jgi:hypothetical protein
MKRIVLSPSFTWVRSFDESHRDALDPLTRLSTKASNNQPPHRHIVADGRGASRAAAPHS